MPQAPLFRPQPLMFPFTRVKEADPSHVPPCPNPPGPLCYSHNHYIAMDREDLLNCRVQGLDMLGQGLQSHLCLQARQKGRSEDAGGGLVKAASHTDFACVPGLLSL
jgi:hypothetical protein